MSSGPLVTAWIAAGLGLLLVPVRGLRRGDPVAARGGHPPTTGSRGRSVAASAAVAVGAVVVLGPVHGAVAAAVLAPATAAGVTALARRTVRAPPDRSFALTLDLAAAALHGGRPLADALSLAAPAAEPPVAAVLARVSGLLRLGAAPDQAWSVASDGPLEQVAAVAVRSATSGVRLAAAFERAAAELRSDCAAAAGMRAQRAGVAAMGPLAACFLPSFVCLGIVPVVIGIARSALGVLP